MARPKTITLTPDALDRNGISTTETLLAARLDYLINGALAVSGSFDRDGIATAQTTAGATALTLDGALGTDFNARKGIYVMIFAATADNTGITFAVVGADSQGLPLTETITGPGSGLTVLGSTKFHSITSVTPSGAIDGNAEVGTNGYVEFSTPQHVMSYHAGTDVGDIDTVYGTDRYGNAQTEALVAVSAGVSTAQAKNFARVDRITAAPAPGGATEFGTDALCESQWYVLNYRGGDFSVGLAVELTGAGTVSVEHTFSDVFATGFVEDSAIVHVHDTLASETANTDGNYASPPVACRLSVGAYTSGSFLLRIVQARSDS